MSTRDTTGAAERSAAERATRRAAHGDEVGAPGLAEALVGAGEYHHPDPLPGRPEVGVLMLKPGIVLAADALTELAARVAECGYRITDARVVPAAVVKRDGLLRRHYHDHWAMAEAGVLLPQERAQLAERYEAAGFVARFGRAPADLPVVPAYQLAAWLGIAPARVGAWAEAAAHRWGVDSGALLGCNEVGELADVQLLPDLAEIVTADEQATLGADVPAAPLFVLNPQLPLLAAWWEDGGDPTVVALLRPASPAPVPWAAMRTAFLGTGAADRWPAGSLRGDILHGASALHYRDGIEMGAARNGVHLSNGAVEAMRESVVWFDADPAGTALGAALAAAGIEPAAVLAAVLVEDGTGRHPIAQATAHLQVADAAARLIGGRLLAADGSPVRV